ncbi:MAG: tetratricopeptide repeat protein, partial [Alphaproteobacteria bacterium]|nr:tetratricopeptide repeat protein [Alphaproteobacteria bacterium]
PSLVEAYNNRGNVWRDLGAIDEALEDYSQAGELDPGYLRGRNNRAVAWMSFNEIDRAISDFRTAIALVPDDPAQPTYAALALYEVQAELEQGLEFARLATDVAPNSWIPMLVEAHILAALGYQSEALSAFSSIVELAEPQLLRDLKLRLGALGYDPGPFDGAWDSASQAALEACARDGCNLLAR